jgi:APA family basic amino acid/polyamine antiporter
VAVGICYYFVFRRSRGLPATGSVPRDWEKEQVALLTSADEPDLLEQYKSALAARERRRA